jgi:hypothetical protein
MDAEIMAALEKAISIQHLAFSISPLAIGLPKLLNDIREPRFDRAFLAECHLINANAKCQMLSASRRLLLSVFTTLRSQFIFSAHD